MPNPLLSNQMNAPAKTFNTEVTEDTEVTMMLTASVTSVASVFQSFLVYWGNGRTRKLCDGPIGVTVVPTIRPIEAVYEPLGTRWPKPPRPPPPARPAPGGGTHG